MAATGLAFVLVWKRKGVAKHAGLDDRNLGSGRTRTDLSARDGNRSESAIVATCFYFCTTIRFSAPSLSLPCVFFRLRFILSKLSVQSINPRMIESSGN